MRRHPSPRRRRWARRLALSLALLVVLWLLGSYAAARRLTGRLRPAGAEAIPASLGGKVEAFRLDTGDGEQLGAWFLPGQAGTPGVVLVHGNGGGRTACLEQARLLGEMGCAVLMITVRAHGDSTGEVNDFGLGARHDVAAAVGWLRGREPGRPIVVWGQSLGSAAALFAAAEISPPVEGYILECPYRDLWTAVRNRTRRWLPPVLDQTAYLGLALVGPLVLPQVDDIAPVRAAAKVPAGVPVLILAGGADRLASPDEASDIQRALGPRAELLVFEGAGHLGLLRADPGRYREAVGGFLGRVRR